MILLLISFIAGVLTVLAPCVLPLLPVVVGGSMASGSRRRAYVICVSLGASVLLFTLLLKASTAFIGVPQEVWQWVSGAVLVAFGVAMIFPRVWDSLPFVNTMSRSSNALLGAGYRRDSLTGDLLMGAALGPVFASCSPTYFVILATVLPASFFAGLADLLAYVVGLSGFLLIIAITGQAFVDKLGVTIEPGGWFRRAIGVLFLIVGLAVATGGEVQVERWLLSNGFDVTTIEQRLLMKMEEKPMCSGRHCVGTSTLDVRADAARTGDAESGTAAGTSAAVPPVHETDAMTFAQKAAKYPTAPELTGIDGYINTGGAPITVGEFKGKKVVLIDIWTYSCINCQRTLPYIKDWYEKYHDKGLEIIGVHTPEFAFEHVLSNVQNAVDADGIKYPVVLDNEYKTWNAFGNQFWPRKYLIDIDGFIVYDHAGEGDYAGTEEAIRAALEERAQRLGISFDTQTPLSAPADETSTDLSQIRSPETYFGANRNVLFGNGTPNQVGAQTLALPSEPVINTFYLGGAWNIRPEYAQNTRAGASIQYRFAAKDVYLVAAADAPVRIKVLVDGVAGKLHGADVAADGSARIQANKLYKLVEGDSYGLHVLEIQVLDEGLQAYTFTFG